MSITWSNRLVKEAVLTKGIKNRDATHAQRVQAIMSQQMPPLRPTRPSVFWAKLRGESSFITWATSCSRVVRRPPDSEERQVFDKGFIFRDGRVLRVINSPARRALLSLFVSGIRQRQCRSGESSVPLTSSPSPLSSEMWQDVLVSVSSPAGQRRSTTSSGWSSRRCSTGAAQIKEILQPGPGAPSPALNLYADNTPSVKTLKIAEEENKDNMNQQNITRSWESTWLITQSQQPEWGLQQDTSFLRFR